MPARILIIEDYADNRELMRLMLEMVGYLVSEASDGSAGLQLALDAAPDVALIDISMPGLDGWEVLSALRADARTRSVACVAVSAFAEGARERALSHGFDAFLTKPFRRNELIETVKHLLTRVGSQDTVTDRSPVEEKF